MSQPTNQQLILRSGNIEYFLNRRCKINRISATEAYYDKALIKWVDLYTDEEIINCRLNQGVSQVRMRRKTIDQLTKQELIAIAEDVSKRKLFKDEIWVGKQLEDELIVIQSLKKRLMRQYGACSGRALRD